MRVLQLLLSLFIVAVLHGCAGGSGTGVDLRSLLIRPESARLDSLGESVQFSARVVQDGVQRAVTGNVSWSSSNTSVVSIDPLGRAEAVGNGSSTITARADGLSETVTVQVEQEIAAVTFDAGNSVELNSIGQGLQLTVTPRDENGNPVEADDPEYSTSNPSVATVTSNGIVEAIGNGFSRVTATVAGQSGTIDVIVDQKATDIALAFLRECLSAEGTLPISAILTDARGNLMPNASVTWETSDPGVATVDGEGTVSGVSAGTVEITARESEAMASARLLVEDSSSGIDDFDNRPCGFMPFSDQNWDELGSNGWGHLNRDSESVIEDDPDAPFSPPGVLEHRYPGPDGWQDSNPGAQGFPGGSEPAVDWTNLQSRGEVFLSLWWFANAEWEGHPSNVNKVLFLWDEDFESNIIFSMRGPPGGPYFLQPVSSGNPDARTQYLELNRSTRRLIPGRWYQIEIYVKMDTAGNGIIRWWQDGELLGEYTDFTFRADGLGQFEFAPTWGGINFFKSRDDFFRYDHIRFWGR